MTRTPEELVLARAKIQLMKRPNSIFYTTVLFSLKQVFTDRIKTAATDGLCLYINPSFFLNDLTEGMRIGVLVHEIMHPILNHITRKGDKHHELWNIAGDHVINLALLNAGYMLPTWVCKDARFEGMNTDTVYKILWDEKQQEEANGGSGLNGLVVPGGSDIEYPTDPIESDKIEKSIADIILKAATQAKMTNEMPGELPGEVEVNLQEILNPKLPWEVIYQNYMSDFAKDDYSWAKPNRRYLPNCYLPSQYSEAICNIVIAIDSSGSVSDEEFSFFIAEIKEVQERLHPEKITLLDFDTILNSEQDITSETDILNEISFSGRGGTRIIPVLKWANINNPTVLSIFTDGEFKIPKEKYWPKCPVFWLIHNNPNFTAPFGEIIHYEI